MNPKTKNLISVIFPLTTILIIAITWKTQPTGLAIYENKTLYKINANITIDLQEKIPADSYIRIQIDDYTTKINIIEFLERSKKHYEIYEGDIVANDTYTVDFISLGIILSFEKGKHKIRTEIVHKDLILDSSEEIIEV